MSSRKGWIWAVEAFSVEMQLKRIDGDVRRFGLVCSLLERLVWLDARAVGVDP
jgi:hypothetical protein